MSSALKVLTTRLVLPPDQQLTSNQIANFLLAPIQYILGQTVVKKEGDQFVKTPVPPSLVKTALLIVSLATSTRYFGHWPGLGFVAAVALGTAARVYSMSHSPELREGLFGKTTSTTPSQPLQQQPSSPSCPSENTPLPTEDSKDPVTVPKIDLEPSPPPHPSNSSVVQDTIPSPPPQPVEPPPTAPTNPYQTLIDTIDRLFPKEKKEGVSKLKKSPTKTPSLDKNTTQVLNFFLQTIPVVGNLQKYKKNFPQRKELMETFLKTEVSQVESWLNTAQNRSMLSTTFALLRNLHSLASLQAVGLLPKAISEYKQLHNRCVLRLMRLQPQLTPPFDLKPLHPETKAPLEKELNSIITFLQKSSASSTQENSALTPTEKAYLLKAYFLLQTSHPEIQCARDPGHGLSDQFQQLTSLLQQFEVQFQDPPSLKLIQASAQQFDASLSSQNNITEIDPSNLLKTLGILASGQAQNAMKEFYNFNAYVSNDFFKDFISQFNQRSKLQDVQSWLETQQKHALYFYPFQFLRKTQQQQEVLNYIDHKERQSCQKNYKNVCSLLNHFKLNTFLEEVSPDVIALVEKTLEALVKALKPLLEAVQLGPKAVSYLVTTHSQNITEALAQIHYFTKHPLFTFFYAAIGTEKIDTLLETCSTIEKILTQSNLTLCIPTPARIDQEKDGDFSVLLA